MRWAIALWSALALLYLVPFLHSLLGYPLTRGRVIPEPNPAISFQESTADTPPDAAFAASGFRTITRGEAYSFTLGGPATPCDRMWRSALRNMGWGEKVQVSGPLPGRSGLCEWYSLWIVDADGQKKAGFGRPGPRMSGQLPGPPVLVDPDKVRMVNGRHGSPMISITRLRASNR